MRRLARLLLGSLFLLLGLAGLVLPVLQGCLFLALGIIILSRDVPLFGRMEAWTARRFPRVGRRLLEVRKKFSPQSEHP